MFPDFPSFPIGKFRFPIRFPMRKFHREIANPIVSILSFSSSFSRRFKPGGNAARKRRRGNRSRLRIYPRSPRLSTGYRPHFREINTNGREGSGWRRSEKIGSIHGAANVPKCSTSVPRTFQSGGNQGGWPTCIAT